jgi:hypothetical protein
LTTIDSELPNESRLGVERMTARERSLLQGLDTLLRSLKVHARIQPVVERVCAQLAKKPERALMSWEAIPLTIYDNALPPAIRSSWVFVLRAGTDTGAERHPNSHQRMMSLQGTGDMRIGEDASIDESPNRSVLESKRISESKVKDAEAKIRWKSNVLVSEPDAPLQRRWVSIPPNVWHRPVVGHGADWIVVSFHTVPAEELIEERPDPEARVGTRQMRYLEHG